MVSDRQIDKIRGVIFGNAIGDALGRATEFMEKDGVYKIYPKGIHSYKDIDMKNGFRSIWKRGEWTDDTNQMICILDCILEKQSIDPIYLANRFLRWAIEDGRGIGENTYKVFMNPRFSIDPLFVSANVWEKSGFNAAPNGGVMRTSVLGTWDFENTANVKNNTALACKITHYDPRCVASCIAVTVAISKMLQGWDNTHEITGAAMDHACDFSKDVVSWLESTKEASIGFFELDKEGIGYTFKTMAAGFWALNNSKNFAGGLSKIIHEAGDADTNGAVAGALLGAKFGFSAIPKHLVNGLLGKNELHNKIDKLIQLQMV